MLGPVRMMLGAVGLMLGAVLMPAALAGGAGASTSLVAPGQRHYFRTEVTGGTDRRGRPVVSGFVYNDHGLPAYHVQLDVEVLDAGGQVLSRTLSYEDTMVPNFGRAYFEQRVPALGASYRVTVRSVEWMRTGGM
jgi:hypothetical protein